MPTELDRIRALPKSTGWLSHAKLNDYMASSGQDAPSGQNWTFDQSGNPTLQKNDSILKTVVLPAALSMVPFLPSVFGNGASAATNTAATATTGAAATSPNIFKTVANVAKEAAPYASAASAFVQGRAAGRAANDAAATDYDQLNLARYAMLLRMLDAENSQKQFLTQQALRGGLMEGVQDPTIQAPAGIPMGSITGGLKPSAIVGRSELGAELRRKAMLELLDPNGVNVPDVPELSERDSASWLDTLMGGVSAGLSGYNLFQDMRKPKPSTGVVNPNVVRGAGVSFLPRPTVSRPR